MTATASKGRRAASYAALAAGGVAGLAAVSATGLAAYFTRRVVTPLVVKPDDLEIFEVHAGPGRAERHAGHCRARALRPVARRRRRARADRADPEPGRGVGDARRWRGRLGESAAGAGPVQPVLRRRGPDDRLGDRPRGRGGRGPRWATCRPGWSGRRSIPATTPAADLDGVWAVLVHGRGATREECLRGVPVLHRLGLTTLVPSYRNDRDAPGDPAGPLPLRRHRVAGRRGRRRAGPWTMVPARSC